MQTELKPVPNNDSVFRGNAASHGAGALAPEAHKVLRNTYLLLALTMVPTVIGAMLGMSTAGLVMQHPIMISLVMLAAVIGLQFAIAANARTPSFNALDRMALNMGISISECTQVLTISKPCLLSNARSERLLNPNT